MSWAALQMSKYPIFSIAAVLEPLGQTEENDVQ
jgi:hypothetical protein